METASYKLGIYVFESKINIPIYFLLAGYINGVQYVYEVSGAGDGSAPNVQRLNFNNDSIIYGASFNGESETIKKLTLDWNEKMSFDLLPLKDAIDLAEFFIDITIKAQRFERGRSTCGDPIDILVITKDYAKFIKHKILNP